MSIAAGIHERAGRAFAVAMLALTVLVSACASRPARPAAAAASPASVATSPSDEDDDAEAEAEPDAPAETDPDHDLGRPPSAGRPGEAREPEHGPCPPDMALVAERVCVDKYEASLVEVVGDGVERPYPSNLPVDGHTVRAVSAPGVLPQGFISEVQAADACAASGKRLCTHDEWKTACMGPAKTTFPYGEARRPGVCHDTGKSAVVAVFGAKAVAASTPYPGAGVTATPRTPAARTLASKRTASAPKKNDRHARVLGRAAQTTHARAVAHRAPPSPSKRSAKSNARAGKRLAARRSAKPASVDPGVWAKLNDPALGQVEGALAKTGEHPECVNGWGVFDMVGNLHEWVATDASLPNGTFAGGYYLDTTINGDGCNYRTVAHAHDYHDYSTGFRCCADPEAGAASSAAATALPALPR